MLSEDQRSRIRICLGYPDTYRYKHTRLEGVLSALNGQFTLDAEARIIDSLAGIALVDAKIQTAILARAGIKRVDEIEFFKSAVYNDIARLGRMYISRLSIATGVPIENDYYGSQGYGGDSYSAGGMSGRGGNHIRLG